MSHLIDELKQDHRAILNALEGIKEAGVTTVEGQQRLRDTRRMILDHLRKEDSRFYPAVRTASNDDSELSKTVQSFADHMEAITTYALSFFEKYEGGGTGIDFARDFGRLYATVWRRQQKEESVLYREYERVAGRVA